MTAVRKFSVGKMSLKWLVQPHLPALIDFKVSKNGQTDRQTDRHLQAMSSEASYRGKIVTVTLLRCIC